MIMGPRIWRTYGGWGAIERSHYTNPQEKMRAGALGKSIYFPMETEYGIPSPEVGTGAVVREFGQMRDQSRCYSLWDRWQDIGDVQGFILADLVWWELVINISDQGAQIYEISCTLSPPRSPQCKGGFLLSFQPPLSGEAQESEIYSCHPAQPPTL